MHPLESICVAIAEGRLAVEQGEHAAAALAAGGTLGLPLLLDWFGTAVWLSEQEQHWERGALLGRVLASALPAVPLDRRDRQSVMVVGQCQARWAHVAHCSLVHRPSAWLFTAGIAAAHGAQQAAEAAGDRSGLGRALYLLGVLHLDPFSRHPRAWHEEHRLWLSLARPEEAAGLPEPAVALGQAERYLRHASEICTGPSLGYIYKALAQALQQQRALGLSTGAAAEQEELCDKAAMFIPADDIEALVRLDQLRPVRRAGKFRTGQSIGGVVPQRHSKLGPAMATAANRPGRSRSSGIRRPHRAS